ncbi:MAG: hypothetical protein ACLT4H_12640 [Bacteroides thetaiotaomicron]
MATHRLQIMKFCLVAALALNQSLCSCTDTPLENALQKAKENRSEIEKVLEYFSQSPNDSLKYKAAQFLIENMPGHFTYSNDSIHLLHVGENKCPYDKNKWAINLQAELLYIRYFTLLGKNKLKKSEDIENLTSDFLIKHIETVFQKKDSCLWLQDVNFEDFCEYLLPYRIGQEQPSLWRDSVFEGFAQLHNYIQNYDDTRTSSLSLSKRLLHIARIPWTEAISILPPSISSYRTDCEDTATRLLILYRLCNIPAAIDMIPCWGNYNGKHVWAQPIERRRRYTNELEKFNWTTIPKVYRKTYSSHPIIAPKNEFIPPFFLDSHLKDVTKEYINTIQVTEKSFPKSVYFGYLCVFNRGKWIPVAQSINHSGKCIFPDMGPGIVYLPAYFNNDQQLIPTSNPFRLKNNGEKIYLQAKQNRGDLILKRKYPLNNTRFIDPSIDLIVETSSTNKFNKCDTFHIKKDLLMQPVNIETNQKHRYFRITPNNYSMIAEIYFLNKNGKRIHGHLENTNQYKKLQDNDILTYEYIPPLNFYINPTDTISSMQILPYNDGNGIYPEDEYELFYFDKEKQWISCGYKTANNYFIKFENVPLEALYWLQNLTTGKEERIFTFENGKQRFW